MGKALILDWHLEVERVKLNRKQRYLWKAIGVDGEVLDFYASEDRDEAAARQFLEKAIKEIWSGTRIPSDISTHRRK